MKSKLLKKISEYCNGVWRPNKKDEAKFLSSCMLKKLTGNNKSMNTGKLSEWYVGEILKKKGIKYQSQPVVKYTDLGSLNSTGSGSVNSIYKTRNKIYTNWNCMKIIKKSSRVRFIQPDYYIPEKDLFIEVKSRSYNCGGTASEKLDHIVRKYSKLEFTKDYKKSKLLIVCSAYELYEESTCELLYYNQSSRGYIKDFINLSKKYNILDWIPINKLESYIK